MTGARPRTALARRVMRLPRAFRRYAVEPALRLRVQRWHIRNPGWTAPPIRIALISDFHVGVPSMPMRRVEQIVRRTNACAPDLVLLGGDFAPAIWPVLRQLPFDEVAACLATLTAPLGRFAVLGNHDWDRYRSPGDRMARPNPYAAGLEAAGIPILPNTARKLGEFWLLGVDSQRAFGSRRRGYSGLHDLNGALAQLTDAAPAILLAHEPDIFPEVPDRVALTLSGHTHGGQIRVFGRTPVVPSHHGSRYAYGHVREGQRDLVVSGGLGCSGLPLRLGVTPEITLVELRG